MTPQPSEQPRPRTKQGRACLSCSARRIHQSCTCSRDCGVDTCMAGIADEATAYAAERSPRSRLDRGGDMNHTERANAVLSKRWPDALIGEERKYHGPVSPAWDGPVDWVLTESGWQASGTLLTLRARREAKVRDDIERELSPFPPLIRHRIIRRVARLFGRKP